MLANALVCVALIALAANTILSAGLLSTRTTLRRTAQSYLNREYQRATQALVTEVAPFASSGSFPDPLPSFTLAPECIDAGSPCRLTSSAAVSPAFADSESPQTCDSASACANNEQQNPYVGERRIVAAIAVYVEAADGSVLANRSAEITLRTLHLAPYVAIVGARDDTSGLASADAPAGEDAGRPPATANPCTSGAPGTADDTVVRVAYRNALTGACSDAGAWRSSAYSHRGAFNLTR